MSETLKSLIAEAAEAALTRSRAIEAFRIIMSGEATPAQIGGFLMTLRTRGESVDEIAGAASVMRDKAAKVSAPEGAMDIVGTGGDGKGTLNISTAAAFVVAGCGVPVAKHGNRALSSKSGAADALTEMGVNVMVEASVAQAALDACGIWLHDGADASLGHAPCRPGARGVGDKNDLQPIGTVNQSSVGQTSVDRCFRARVPAPDGRDIGGAGVRGRLVGSWVGRHGRNLDLWFQPGRCTGRRPITEFEVHPEQAGLPVHPFDAIRGGKPADNAQAFRALMDGATGGYRDAVCLNSGAALLVAGVVPDLKTGAERAAQALDSGAAKAKVQALAVATNAG